MAGGYSYNERENKTKSEGSLQGDSLILREGKSQHKRRISFERMGGLLVVLVGPGRTAHERLNH